MIRRSHIVAALVCVVVAPLSAQDAPPAYDFRERVRALAFDPSRFYPEPLEPIMTVRYMGDDYAFPVYTIAVRKGCTRADQGEARRTCGQRLVARMVRSPFTGEPPRPRNRGQRLFATIGQSQPQSDEALLTALDDAGLEWLEADVRRCPSAMAHLATAADLKFAAAMPLTRELPEIVMHADTVTFQIADYLSRSRYEGWLKPGSPGAWANAFAASLEPCWRPATAPVPWRMIEGS